MPHLQLVRKIARSNIENLVDSYVDISIEIVVLGLKKSQI